MTRTEASIRETKVRIVSSLQTLGCYSEPTRDQLEAATSPADDLPLALRVLGVNMAGHAAFGELDLKGWLRSTRGALAMARQSKCSLFVPEHNANEASWGTDEPVYAVRALTDVVAHFTGKPLPRFKRKPWAPSVTDRDPLPERLAKPFDLACRAIRGGKVVLLIGPPGAGKTMIARRLSGALDPLSFDESRAATEIHSAAGLLRDDGLLRERPFRAPHHTCSERGLVGSASGPFRHGEVALAAHGVLFLDEVAEFSLAALKGLRTALIGYPETRLVLASNPCPCGTWKGAMSGRVVCQCKPEHVARFRGRWLDWLAGSRDHETIRIER